MKKIFLIGLGIIVIILLGLFVLSRQGATTTKQSGSSSETSGVSFPTSVGSAVLSGSVLRYTNTANGDFESLDLGTGKKETFSPYLINSQQILWSPDGNNVLNISGSDSTASVIAIDKNNGGASAGGNLQNNLGVITLLNPAAQTPTWSSDSKQILYQYVDPNTKLSTITAANADGSNWQNIVAAPNIFSALWWSPLGTYAIGLDATTNPPQYDLIAISSKTITKLAAGFGTLKWSPSGTFALLDSSDGKTLQIANVTSGAVTTVNIPGSVQQFTWQDETHLVGMNSGKFVSVDLSMKQSNVVGDASKLDEFTSVLGIYKNQVIYLDNGTVGSVTLNQ